MSQKLFIVGAAKAGTTSLQAYLNQHPQICFSAIKEPHFFSQDINLENFREEYKKALYQNRKTNHQAFIRKLEEYKRLFESCSSKHWQGDASTSYLYSKVAAKSIYEFAPTAKIIVIIRNPVERAFSHYAMNRRAGFTDLPFIDEIKKDQRHKNRAWGQAHLYVDLGLYHHQVKRYLNHYSKDQLNVIRFEDFSANTERVLEDVLDFLELSQASLNLTEVHNPKRIPKNRAILKFVKKVNLTAYIPKTLKAKGRRLLYQSKDDLPNLEAAEKKYLTERYFKSDIQQLENLLNLDLSQWYE